MIRHLFKGNRTRLLFWKTQEQKTSLRDLALSQRRFIDRHIGPDQREIGKILNELG